MAELFSDGPHFSDRGDRHPADLQNCGQNHTQEQCYTHRCELVGGCAMEEDSQKGLENG